MLFQKFHQYMQFNLCFFLNESLNLRAIKLPCKYGHRRYKFASIAQKYMCTKTNGSKSDGDKYERYSIKETVTNRNIHKIENDDSTPSFDYPSNAADNSYMKQFWSHYEKKVNENRNVSQDIPYKIDYRQNYDQEPISRVKNMVKDEFSEHFRKLKYYYSKYSNQNHKDEVFHRKVLIPNNCDVLIIGGGIVGASIAYHLQERASEGLSIAVIEKDLSYSKASTVLSVGGIRQQFSTPENIMLSKYGMDLLQYASRDLSIKGEDPVQIPVSFDGYLTLGSEETFPQLLQNYSLQVDNGAYVKLLTKDQLKERFPWINTQGIEGGVYGVQREGWFDPWVFLMALIRKARSLGTKFVNAEVTNVDVKNIKSHAFVEEKRYSAKNIDGVEVTLPNGEVRYIKCALCFLAAGAWSKDVGMMMGIGKAERGPLSIPIPVEPRKRFVYCVKSPNGPALNCPLVIEPSGAYFRREGLADLYLCGQSPSESEEPTTENLQVDHEFFTNQVWPSIAHRCPSFNNLKMHSSWAGYYDYNTIDQNAIIGTHPAFANLYMATGFSGHGIQHAAGAGKALSELIVDGGYVSMNVERLSFDRIMQNRPLKENNIY